MFSPERFKLARQRRGLSKKALAARTGSSPRTISAYEASDRTPSRETLGVFSRELGFPVEFFFAGDVPELKGDGASFRSLSRMTASQRDAALAAGSLGLLLGSWIEEKFRLPECSLPDFHEGGDPETVAESMRVEWGLGDRPIRNVVHLLESKGVRVFTLVEDCKEVDAFSLWNGATPFVFLNTRKSAERSRFDACHELGHLLMHRHGSATGRPAEEQANAFAASFLMPRIGVIARSSRSPSLQAVLNEKQTWGVSAMAYGFRLHKLGLLSDWYYQQIMKKLSTLGFRSRELPERPRETSQVLRKVFDSLKASGVSKRGVAQELHIDLEELNKLVFGLVMTGLAGQGRGSSRPDRSHLRLVPRK